MQVKQTLRASVLLLIRWFRVRPPGAPPAISGSFLVVPWTYLDHQPQVVAETRKHKRIRNFPDKEVADRPRPGPGAARYSRQSGRCLAVVALSSITLH